MVLTVELFDGIEINAARTGNHRRAAVRMSRLAARAQPGGISLAEAHVRGRRAVAARRRPRGGGGRVPPGDPGRRANLR